MGLDKQSHAGKIVAFLRAIQEMSNGLQQRPGSTLRPERQTFAISPARETARAVDEHARPKVCKIVIRASHDQRIGQEHLTSDGVAAE